MAGVSATVILAADVNKNITKNVASKKMMMHSAIVKSNPKIDTIAKNMDTILAILMSLNFVKQVIAKKLKNNIEKNEMIIQTNLYTNDIKT